MSLINDKGVEIINGCPVIMEVKGAKIIEHPAGYMAYRGFRIGIRKTKKGIIALAERTAHTN